MRQSATTSLVIGSTVRFQIDRFRKIWIMSIADACLEQCEVDSCDIYRCCYQAVASSFIIHWIPAVCHFSIVSIN